MIILFLRSQLDPKNNTKEYFYSRIKYFRSFFYQYERHDDFVSFREFQQFLDHYATKDNETFYNVLRVMTKVSSLIEHKTFSLKLLLML